VSSTHKAWGDGDAARRCVRLAASIKGDMVWLGLVSRDCMGTGLRYNPNMDMQRWRSSLPAFARWVLAALVLTVLSSVVSTFSQRGAYALGCSSFGSVQLLAKAAGDQPGQPMGHTLDCPLCVAFLAPPPALPRMMVPVAPQRHGTVPRLHTQVALVNLAPMPARGPPQA